MMEQKPETKVWMLQVCIKSSFLLRMNSNLTFSLVPNCNLESQSGSRLRRNCGSIKCVLPEAPQFSFYIACSFSNNHLD